MIFTIDNDNDIRAHETEAQAEEASKPVAGTIVVRSEKDLNKAAVEWPASRLVELWNSFAGVAPFTDCKPVKKFATRDKAVGRIWTTIQQLGNANRPGSGGQSVCRNLETERGEIQGYHRHPEQRGDGHIRGRWK
jgi:hypothetical protein